MGGMTTTNSSCCRASGEESLALLFLCVSHFHRPAGVAPGAKAAGDVGNGLQPHALRSLGSKRRARAAGAEEYEFPVLRERRLVILAGGVEPEFQHAARAMKRTRNAPLAVELANVAQIDERHIVPAVKPNGIR